MVWILAPLRPIQRSSEVLIVANWVQDDLTDIEKEEIDRAIALSLSEEDQKGKKVIGKIYTFANGG